MRFNSRYCVLTAGLLVIAAAGCGVNEPAPPTGEIYSFAEDIAPMLEAKCASCHQPGGVAELDGIPVDFRADTAHASMVNVASVQDNSWILVVPGNAEQSLVYLKVSRRSPPVGFRMPLAARALSSQELGRLRDWINQGAEDN